MSRFLDTRKSAPEKHIDTAPRHQRSIETELRFFVPESTFKRIVVGIEPARISQSYLPKSLIPQLCDHFRIKNGHTFSVARLRHSAFSSLEPSYELELKTPKKIGAIGERISREILQQPVALSQSDFNSLKTLATKGTIVKDRYLLPGTVGVGNNPPSVTAEVDRFIECGKHLGPIQQPFVIVEIELPENLINDLLGGRHSFLFLGECPPVNYPEQSQGRALSNRKIAKNGIQAKQLKALEYFSQCAARLRG